MDDRKERIPIYSYPARYQQLFALISLGLTVGFGIITVWIEWDWADGDSARETINNILVGLPIGWLLGIIVAIIAVEVSGVIKDYIDLKKARAEAKAEAKARAEAEAEVKRLRAELKRLRDDNK